MIFSVVYWVARRLLGCFVLMARLDREASGFLTMMPCAGSEPCLADYADFAGPLGLWLSFFRQHSSYKSRIACKVSSFFLEQAFCLASS